MKARLFYSAALILSVVSLVLGFVGRDRSIQASHYKAKRIESAYEDRTPYTPDPQAVQLARDGRVFNTVAAVFTGSALCCMVVALRRREKGWYLIL